MKNLSIKFKALIGLSILTAGLGGCNDKSEISKTVDAGRIVDASIATTSFNESIKSVIKTDKAVFMVRGMPSVFIGESATVQITTNGDRYLCIEGWKKCQKLYP